MSPSVVATLLILVFINKWMPSWATSVKKAKYVQERVQMFIRLTSKSGCHERLFSLHRVSSFFETTSASVRAFVSPDKRISVVQSRVLQSHFSSQVQFSILCLKFHRWFFPHTYNHVHTLTHHAHTRFHVDVHAHKHTLTRTGTFGQNSGSKY